MLLLLLVLLITAGPAAADETTVTTDPDRSAVVIDGSRSGSGSHIGPYKPCLEYVLTPRQEGVLPADSIVAIPCRGSGVRRVTRALREQVIRYLPPLLPAMAPAQHALVNVPQIYWSNQHTVRFDVTVLGRDVSVVMHPRFEWNFGDGASLVTSRPGAPYPSRELVHTYRSPCRCVISVETTWSGQWSDGTGWHPLNSLLTQRKSLSLDVRRAPIRLTE